MIRIGLPNKGRLSENSIALLQKAGFKIQKLQRELSQVCENYDMEIVFARASDIPMLLDKGVLDLGITGLDLVKEQNIDIDQLLSLGFGRGKLVLAAPKGKNLDNFNGQPIKIATSYPNIARQYCKKNKIQSEIVTMNGAVELSPKIGTAQVIIDLTSTGATLQKNGLTIVGDILETQACLFSNKLSNEQKSRDIQKVITAINSVLLAREKKFLLANVSKEQLSQAQRIVPGINGTTVMSISNDPKLCAIQAVVSEEELVNAIEALQNLGATGILVMNFERIIP